MPHVVVVGGGIAGAATAWYLSRAAQTDDDGNGLAGTGLDHNRLDVTVLEGSSRLGGKLQSVELAGATVDTGAEAILNRRPEGVELAREVGLGSLIRHPAATTASLWSRDTLRQIPAGTVMGIPGDLAALELSGVLSASGLTRAAQEPEQAGDPLDDDVAVGAYARARFGPEVVDRLIEPLLGGVYAGRADLLSLRATIPALVPFLREHPSLVRAVARAKAAAPASGAPVFAGLDGGVAQLVPATLAASGARVRTNATVRELRHAVRGSGWELVVGPTARPELVDADAVVLACPARPAGRLLATVAPTAARELAGLEYASMATVALAFPARAVAGSRSYLGPGSGFLVPPTEPRLIKAATFSSAKWPWLTERAQGLVIVRCSIGRLGEVGELQRDDADLVGGAVADLRAATGISEEPVEAHVARWGGGLPQYVVGHQERVARIRTDVARHPGLAVAGAAYDGIGIPACIAGARTAATHVLASVRRPGRMTA